MLCTDLKEQICVAFMIFFPIYQLMAPVDSDIDLNKWKERVVSVKAVIIYIHVLILLGQAVEQQEIPQIPVSIGHYSSRWSTENL